MVVVVIVIVIVMVVIVVVSFSRSRSMCFILLQEVEWIDFMLLCVTSKRKICAKHLHSGGHAFLCNIALRYLNSPQSVVKVGISRLRLNQDPHQSPELGQYSYH